METMRKEWGSPMGNVQRFAPQEYVADCGDLIIDAVPSSTNRAYTRIDFNGNGICDITYTGGTLTYTERGWDHFGADAGHKIPKNRIEIVGVNVYKIHVSASNITPGDEDGHSFNNGDYDFVAAQLVRDKNYPNKYYFLNDDYSGAITHYVNAS